MVINQKAISKISIVTILVTFLMTLVGVKPVHAGAPWNPELVSPSNNSQGDGNPPQLCAKNMGDPEGDSVQIRFEVWGGSEADHISPWIDAGSAGNIVCWRDSAPWTTETHSWAARAVDNHGEQSGASPAWAVQVPSSPTPVPTCTIGDLAVSPPDPQPVGTVLSIYASASCSNSVSFLRFSADGNVIGTVSGASGTVNWNTTGEAATAHTITVEAADEAGVIRKSRSTNYDLTSGAPPPTPDVNCSINSFSFYPSSPQPPGTSVQVSTSASCDTGVRAIRIKIGGSIQYEIGAPSVSWTWNTSGRAAGNYSVTVEAAGLGDNDWSQAANHTSTYRLEQSVPTSAPVVNSFSTGDVIKIVYDVYVIVNGQLRLVPNPATLDALGVSQNAVNNKGFSANDLETIPRGSDIPDINIDYEGFAAFKNQVFPNTEPIVPQLTSAPVSQPTQELQLDVTQPVSVPTPYIASEGDPFWCDWFIIGTLFCQRATEVEASTNLKCTPQCVAIGHKKRPDIRYWPSGGTSDKILAKAISEPTFEYKGSEMQVRVRASGETPEGRDLVIWPSRCGGAWSEGGHIGYVTSARPGYITVHDANWDNECSIRDKEIEILSCMRFITSPYLPHTITNTNQPIDKCSQFGGFRWILCKWFGWN